VYFLPQGPQFTHPQNKSRFYIVMITVFVAAILFLLVINNQEGKVFSITSAIIGNHNNETEENKIIKSKIGLEDKIKDSNKEIEVVLSFDQIPSVSEEVSVQTIGVNFDEAKDSIKINQNALEINNVDQVNLELEEFDGKLEFDILSFTLNGRAKKIKVNEMAFSSRDGMDVQITDISYSKLSLMGIGLNGLELPSGNGELEVSGRLSYNLDNEPLEFYYFEGQLILDKANSTALQLDGNVKGLSSGGELDLMIK